MNPLNWLIVVAWLAYVAIDGLRRSKGTKGIEGYFLASRSMPWWAVGLSVMATQLSAITLVGTTGKGYADGMRFVQFYFGLPIAMIILSMTLVPFFYRSGVYTAYEYLEQRFDVKTRTLAALIFLAQRGLSCGVIIAAPAMASAAPGYTGILISSTVTIATIATVTSAICFTSAHVTACTPPITV